MAGVLRIYRPAECDSEGVPLDWEKCRACGGCGALAIDDDGPFECPKCAGHGSLKAAVLAGRREVWGLLPGNLLSERIGCEDCGHPMSEGTWEGGPDDPAQFPPGYWLGLAERDLRAGNFGGYLVTHYSPCDEGCRHGGGEVWGGDDDGWLEQDAEWMRDQRKTAGDLVREHLEFRASWRPVDVRCLSWPHDLRPESLAVLCLRCWAGRASQDAGA